ncbi:MAG: hypothetical protein J0M18_02205 [Ignavibacteria bacterium]|nr:hypothetical protein [Ignavibacteria bacterium]
MKDSQLIALLKSLTESEFKEVENLLHSPYYNTSPIVTRLFYILKKSYPLFTSEEYTKEKIFIELFPGKKYNNLLLNEYYHLLSKVIIEHIKLTVLKKNELLIEIEMLNEFRLRGLLNNFNKLEDKIEAKLKNSKYDYSVLNLTYNFHRARINKRTTFESQKRNKQIEEVIKEYNDYLIYLINILVSEYISLSLNYINDEFTLNFKKETIFQKLERNNVIAKLYNYIENVNPFDFNIKINLALIELLKNPTETSNFFVNKKLVMNNADKFSKIELEYYLDFLKAYCIEKSYSPESRKIFLTEYIEMEFYVLQNQLFINSETNYLKSTSFRNLLIMLANLKDNQKLLNLIEYSKFLRPEVRNDFRYFAIAHYHYLLQSFQEALKHLNKIFTQDKQLELDSSFLIIKIYFELKDFLKGIDKINSVRRIINYNKFINFDRKKRYRLFLNYLEKLFRKLEKNDLISAKFLFEEIQSQKNIIFAEWFEEKYVELFPKHRMYKKINA